ncbi:MAG TPA: diguanylate cyclase [Vicinamibacterales bacterium]|nr:diguanylate cyclase [Vicinamibacterales bacterium]
MGYALALVGVLLFGAGYFLGSRSGRSREAALKTTLDESLDKLRLVEHELLRYSAVDPVTGLHTQQHFQEFLEREWRRASRERRFVSVIMIEVDHFRAFNDRQGKPEGDACLKSVANAMKPLIHRPSDLIARYGGAGKFGVVLGATDSKGALLLAERLRLAIEHLATPNPASPTSPTVTASLGVASVTPDRDAAWQDIELIAAAERALAHAKEIGRNTVTLDDPENAPQA